MPEPERIDIQKRHTEDVPKTWRKKPGRCHMLTPHGTPTSGITTSRTLCAASTSSSARSTAKPQPREETWCPWANTDLSEYPIHGVGDADAKVDFTHIDDPAAFLVETIRHPETSENRLLNFISDHISYKEIVDLLRRDSRRKADTNVYPIDVMHRVWKDPEAVPAEAKGSSVFPDDLWILV
ncbi:hypothetical protein BJX64DRAFT_287141 [Aspergillus heterothallicus]